MWNGVAADAADVMPLATSSLGCFAVWGYLHHVSTRRHIFLILIE